MVKSNLLDAVNCIWIANGDNTDDRISVMGKHPENSYILYYIIDGNGTITVNDIEYRLSKGQSFIVFPFSDMKIQTDIKNPWSYKWVEFSGAEPTFLINQISFTKKKPVVGKIELPHFERFFTVEESDLSELYAVYRTVCRLMYLLTYYVEYFPKKSQEQKSYARTARSYIDRNYHKSDFTVKKVADYVKIDRTYLYRLFKEETGLSIIDYINSRKISRAETLLMNEGISIKDVAEAVGFSDQMYFSRVFKKFKGMSPSEFRKNFKPLNFYRMFI